MDRNNVKKIKSQWIGGIYSAVLPEVCEDNEAVFRHSLSCHLKHSIFFYLFLLLLHLICIGWENLDKPAFQIKASHSVLSRRMGRY